jgi:hypothetical protein
MTPGFDPTSKIGRWVAFFILPLATALAALVGVKAKAWFGVDLDPAATVAFILSIAGGIITWLFNRGRYEVAHVLKTQPEDIDARLKLLEGVLPAPPQAPAPGAGSPSSPRAPGRGGVSADL